MHINTIYRIEQIYTKCKFWMSYFWVIVHDNMFGKYRSFSDLKIILLINKVIILCKKYPSNTINNKY